MRRTIYLGTNQNVHKIFMLSVAYSIKFIVSLLAGNMAPAKQSKHSAGFKIKAIQFVKENGNRAAAKMFDVSESSVREWKKNEMAILNMPRNKCALFKEVTK
ncbi:hypothetical protein CDAR_291141 [Caerostris darwini]|uniref:HTH psq-type domain-containing protein n=1 Tax=Caerostris darwini TaxID=1538125 RepID=A0AAV4RM87_9ARAC|nr:hypothetical protein CDAR_291141 [Caerostris darwini]